MRQQHGKLCNLQCEDTANGPDLRHVVRICVFSELLLSQTASHSHRMDSLRPMHLVTFHSNKYNYDEGIQVVVKYIHRSRHNYFHNESSDLFIHEVMCCVF